MTSPADRVGLLQSETQRFHEYLSTLPPEAWNRQSACERWQVGDVVAHLAGGAENYSGNISRGVQGDISPPEDAGPPVPGGSAARLEANAQLAIGLKDRLGEQLLPTFGARCDDLNRLLAGLGPQDWEKQYYHPAAILSLRTFIDLRITEVVVHEWDIRSMLEPGAQISPQGLPAVIDLIPEFVVGRLFQPGSGTSDTVGTVRYRWELTGAAPGNHDILVAAGQARMEPAGDAAPNVTFGCDASDFALLAYGRINFEQAVSDGRISVQGDRDLAAQFSSGPILSFRPDPALR